MIFFKTVRSAGLLAMVALTMAACTTLPTQSPAVMPSPPSANDSSNAPTLAQSQDTSVNAPLAQARVQAAVPVTIDLTAAPQDVWQRLRRGYAIPNIDTPLVQQWQAYYATRPDFIRRVAERASRYLYHIVDEAEKRGLPTELALLPIVESAYNPQALSSARAMGLWQFIPSTGKTYNLKQDWWHDERRDIVASTNAALEYLSFLFDMHGDWHLALASYNWGEGSVKRAIEKNRALGLPTDYLSLSMPDETRNYVPKLQAIKNLIDNPQAFGLTLPPIDNQPYFAAVNRSVDMDLRTAAQLAEMSLEEFKALNPQFHRPLMQGAAHANILLPADKVAVFERNLAQHRGSLSSWRVHSVKSRERLSTIAKRYGLSVQQLAQANHLSVRSKVVSGQVLMVPVRGASTTGSSETASNPFNSAVPLGQTPGQSIQLDTTFSSGLQRTAYEASTPGDSNAIPSTKGPRKKLQSSKSKNSAKHSTSNRKSSSHSPKKATSSHTTAKTSSTQPSKRQSHTSSKSSSQSSKKKRSSTQIQSTNQVELPSKNSVATDESSPLYRSRVVFSEDQPVVQVHALRLTDTQRIQPPLAF